MKTTEHYEELLKAWTESLRPDGLFEEHMVRYIAQLDHLISLSIVYGLGSGDPKVLNREMRNQRTKMQMITSAIRSLKLVQKDRRARQTPPPPKAPAKAKGKLIPFPKTPSVSAIGRPAKIQLEPEPVPNFEPFIDRRRRNNERGSTPSLDLRIAA